MSGHRTPARKGVSPYGEARRTCRGRGRAGSVGRGRIRGTTGLRECGGPVGRWTRGIASRSPNAILAMDHGLVGQTCTGGPLGQAMRPPHPPPARGHARMDRFPGLLPAKFGLTVPRGKSGTNAGGRSCGRDRSRRRRRRDGAAPRAGGARPRSASVSRTGGARQEMRPRSESAPAPAGRGRDRRRHRAGRSAGQTAGRPVRATRSIRSAARMVPGLACNRAEIAASRRLSAASASSSSIASVSSSSRKS